MSFIWRFKLQKADFDRQDVCAFSFFITNLSVFVTPTEPESNESLKSTLIHKAECRLDLAFVMACENVGSAGPALLAGCGASGRGDGWKS